MEAQCHAFLTSTLDRSEWPALCSGRLVHGGVFRCPHRRLGRRWPLCRIWGRQRSVAMLKIKFWFLRRRCRSLVPYWLSYPSPLIFVKYQKSLRTFKIKLVNGKGAWNVGTCKWFCITKYFGSSITSVDAVCKVQFVWHRWEPELFVNIDSSFQYEISSISY